MKFKLLILQIFTTCILLPYIGVFMKLFLGGHKILALLWVLAAAAVTVAIEETIKAIKRKLKGR